MGNLGTGKVRGMKWMSHAQMVLCLDEYFGRETSQSLIHPTMLSAPTISILGQDPNRTHRINANSFQQHAITTINGFQYAAFYSSPHAAKPSTCYVNLSRRPILQTNGSKGAGPWETLIFEDYEQTVDDGHNTISIGVCRGDGTVHVAFDHHCDG